MMASLYNYYQITVHKFWVLYYIFRACYCLIKRGILHDLSKYSKSESPAFAKNVFKLKKMEYGSPEYKDVLKQLGPALQHHYKANAHHPEHWIDGIKDMTQIDIIEMLCDWNASVRKNKNGSIIKSIEINSKRFDYDQNTKLSFINTIIEIAD